MDFNKSKYSNTPVISSFLLQLTYLLTPWCRVLLEKLTGLQLVKKFPAFHGTRRFITALTSVRHLSLSWASPIQSIYPHPTSWRSVLILTTPPNIPAERRPRHHRGRTLKYRIPKLCFQNTLGSCIIWVADKKVKSVFV